MENFLFDQLSFLRLVLLIQHLDRRKPKLSQY